MTHEGFNIKLGRRYEEINGRTVELWHLVSPDLMGRIHHDEWHVFLKKLKRGFPNRLNWSLYPNTPVYEYQSNPNNLQYSIKQLLSQVFEGEVKFELFDYNCSAILKSEVPATYQQHLSI